MSANSGSGDETEEEILRATLKLREQTAELEREKRQTVGKSSQESPE